MSDQVLLIIPKLCFWTSWVTLVLYLFLSSWNQSQSHNFFSRDRNLSIYGGDVKGILNVSGSEIEVPQCFTGMNQNEELECNEYNTQCGGITK